MRTFTHGGKILIVHCFHNLFLLTLVFRVRKRIVCALHKIVKGIVMKLLLIYFVIKSNCF